MLNLNCLDRCGICGQRYLMIFRKNETILVLIGLNFYFSHPEKSILNLSLSIVIPGPGRETGIMPFWCAQNTTPMRFKHRKYSLSLNGPITTKVVCFCCPLKCFRRFFVQYKHRSDCSYIQTASVGAV